MITLQFKVKDLYSFNDLMHNFINVYDYNTQDDLEQLIKMYYNVEIIGALNNDVTVLDLDILVSNFKELKLISITDYNTMKQLLNDYYDIETDDIEDLAVFRKLDDFAIENYGTFLSDDNNIYHVLRFE